MGAAENWRDRSDEELLSGLRPGWWSHQWWRAGCVVVLVVATLLAHGAATALATLSAPMWAQTLGTLLAFVLGVPLATAPYLWHRRRRSPAALELRRRVGELPMHLEYAEIRRELRGLDPGQAGWVLLLRGRQGATATSFRLRADVRIDGAGPVGEWTLVRGPTLTSLRSPLRDLGAWERSLGPLSVSSCREAATLAGSLRGPTRVGRGAARLRFELLVVPVGGGVPALVRGQADDLSALPGPGPRLATLLLRSAAWTPLPG